MFSRYLEGLSFTSDYFENDDCVRFAFKEVGQSNGLDYISRSNACVVGLVRKPKGKNTLFLVID